MVGIGIFAHVLYSNAAEVIVIKLIVSDYFAVLTKRIQRRICIRDPFVCIF